MFVLVSVFMLFFLLFGLLYFALCFVLKGTLFGVWFKDRQETPPLAPLWPPKVWGSAVPSQRPRTLRGVRGQAMDSLNVDFMFASSA